jgi:PilZ domain-containing protein
MEERRQWPRLALAIPVFVRGSDREGNEFLDLGTILNISAGGALFAIHKNLPHGSRVSLEIPAAFPSEKLGAQAKRKFRARIVRTNGRNHLRRYAARLYPQRG